MMRPSPALEEVYLCLAPVDFRKQIPGLAALVEAELALNPLGGQLFVFGNRARDKVKILYWEGAGFCLWQKQLEQARFPWPSFWAGDVARITGAQLNWLLDGMDLRDHRPHARLNYESVL